MAHGQKTSDRQVVVFAINEQLFGIDIANVSEIIRLEKVTPIPQAPYYAEGVINIRGSVIPVINLHTLFGIQTGTRDDKCRVIIAEHDGQKFGLIVDAVYEVKKITPDQIKPAPPSITVDQYYLKGIILDGDRLVVLLDPNKILSPKDMEELQAMEHQT